MKIKKHKGITIFDFELPQKTQFLLSKDFEIENVFEDLLFENGIKAKVTSVSKVKSTISGGYKYLVRYVETLEYNANKSRKQIAKENLWKLQRGDFNDFNR